jgi:ATP-dependent DNA ligase
VRLGGSDLEHARAIDLVHGWERSSHAAARLQELPPVQVVLHEQYEHDGPILFEHACKLGSKGIVSKRLTSRYRSGRSRDWVKAKNHAAPAVKREAEEDWGKQ